MAPSLPLPATVQPVTVQNYSGPTDLPSDDGEWLSDSTMKNWLRRIGFGVVNVWLVFHLVGVFLPAFSIPPSPEIVRDLYWSLRFYPQAIYMDHGYHFFGPDPGDSTLLRYVAIHDDGRSVRGTYPNRDIFPRLRYHRHFMLTEAIPRVADYDEGLGALQAKGYAEQILKATQAKSVRLYRVTHRITDIDRFLAGGRLDDPETYFDESLGTFMIDDQLSVVQR
jgi:hypothetical protein